MKEHFDVTALGLRDYDEMIMHLAIDHNWTEKQMYVDSKGNYYISLNNTNVNVNELYK